MFHDETAQKNSLAAHDLSNWLIQQGLSGASRETILQGYCERIVAAGLPVFRVHIAQSAFHPHFGGIGFDWLKDSGVTSETYAHRVEPNEIWLKSPLYHMLVNALAEFRESLLDARETSRFPILNQLKSRGATDYFAVAIAFVEREMVEPINPQDVPEGVLISWTCDGADGFSEAHLTLIRSTLQPLAMVLKSAANRRIAQDLMQVYLGRDAGNRVLSGEIQRGSLQTIDAAICYFDLIGFTSLAERAPGAVVIEMLNAYLGLAVSVIEDLGGHVLKFMGDGLMAMFDIGDARVDALRALEAAQALSRGISAMNADRQSAGQPVSGFTLALHNGEILYGNIGGESRLDFTVIGPAVNLAARLSDMHKSIGHDILVSDSVRQAAGPSQGDLVSVGRYMLRSASEPMELFTIFDATARS